MCTTTPIRKLSDIFAKGWREHILMPLEIFLNMLSKTVFLPGIKNILVQLSYRKIFIMQIYIFHKLFYCIWNVSRKTSQIML